MPFKSEKQKQWLMINKPEIYQKWKKKYGATPVRVTKIDLKEKSRITFRIVEDENDNPEEVTMVGGTEGPDTPQEQKEVLPQAQTQELPRKCR